MHHVDPEGTRSTAYCSGCNFLAIYLADRACGDRLVLDAVKPPRAVQRANGPGPAGR